MNPLLMFDLDGTLIDSAPDIVVAVNRTLKNHGKMPLNDEVVISHIGEGLKKLIADIFASENLAQDRLNDLELEFLRIYEEEMLNRTFPYPGVEDFLKSYSGPKGIITNKNIAPAKKIISHLGLDNYSWVEVFGADSLPERKPSPLPLQTMMRIAGHNSTNSIMIGDGLPDMISAQNAGVPSIAIGFGYTSHHLLQRYGPVAILRQFKDLSQILNEQAKKFSWT